MSAGVPRCPRPWAQHERCARRRLKSACCPALASGALRPPGCCMPSHRTLHRSGGFWLAAGLPAALPPARRQPLGFSPASSTAQPVGSLLLPSVLTAGITALTLLVTPLLLQLSNTFLLPKATWGHPNGGGAGDLEMSGGSPSVSPCWLFVLGAAVWQPSPSLSSCTCSAAVPLPDIASATAWRRPRLAPPSQSGCRGIPAPALLQSWQACSFARLEQPGPFCPSHFLALPQKAGQRKRSA